MTASGDAVARDRAVGALLGLAVGDATGTTLGFAPPGTFTPIVDLVGGGPFGLTPGQWTDDTSMALCLAESLVETGRLDPADQLRRYARWSQEGYLSSRPGDCFDIGAATSAALARFARDGSTQDAVVDESKQANGSLMRLAPVPIRWHTDVAESARKSGRSNLTTHNAPAPVDACRLMGAMLAALVQGAEWAEVTESGSGDGATSNRRSGRLRTGATAPSRRPRSAGPGTASAPSRRLCGPSTVRPASGRRCCEPPTWVTTSTPPLRGGEAAGQPDLVNYHGDRRWFAPMAAGGNPRWSTEQRRKRF